MRCLIKNLNPPQKCGSGFIKVCIRCGLAKKSLLPAYTEVFEHFELNRNPAHILAEQGHLYTF